MRFNARSKIERLIVTAKPSSSDFGIKESFAGYFLTIVESEVQWGMAKNVLATELQACSLKPLTGFFRDGCCHTSKEDQGMHTICSVMTEDFLIYGKSMGNDLMTPRPEYQFPGLKAGDRWCVCLGRWLEAHEAGFAPPVVLEATHISVSEFVDMEVLRAHAWLG